MNSKKQNEYYVSVLFFCYGNELNDYGCLVNEKALRG